MRITKILILLLWLVAAPIAAIEPGHLDLWIGVEANNAYLALSSEVTSPFDAFAMALQEATVPRTIGSNHLFGISLWGDLNYALSPLFSTGVRTGVALGFVGRRNPAVLTIPLLATFTITPTDWFAAEPAVGMTFITDSPSLVHVDTRIMLRFWNTLELHAGYLYGGVTGFYFSVALQLIKVFDISLPPSQQP